MKALLVHSDRMLSDGHFVSSSLREMAWSLRELLEDFTARTQEREKTLREAADFFRAAETVCMQSLCMDIYTVHCTLCVMRGY